MSLMFRLAQVPLPLLLNVPESKCSDPNREAHDLIMKPYAKVAHGLQVKKPIAKKERNKRHEHHELKEKRNTSEHLLFGFLGFNRCGMILN